jgi:hypothetical protein
VCVRDTYLTKIFFPDGQIIDIGNNVAKFNSNGLNKTSFENYIVTLINEKAFD